MSYERQLSDGSYGTKIAVDDARIQLPTDIQAVYAKTVQTHTDITVGASDSALQTGSYMDTKDYSQLSITVLSDASHAFSVNVQWSHDGINFQGEDKDVINVAGSQRSAGTVRVKAKYAKVEIINGDSATGHKMNAWAYFSAI